MCCEKYANWGLLYLYAELEPEVVPEFEAHLKICPGCQQALAQLKASQQLVGQLPAEEIAPIAYETIMLSWQPRRHHIRKALQSFWASIRSVSGPQPRWVWGSVSVAFLFLMLVYLFNPEFRIFKSSVAPYNETIFDWESGLETSLDDLDQKITQFKTENQVLEKTVLEHDLETSADDFSDQRIEQIQAGIQTLSGELTHLNF